MSNDPALDRQLARARSLSGFLAERVQKTAASLARDLNRVAEAQSAEAIRSLSVSTDEWLQFVVDRARLEEVQERIETLESLAERV